MIVGYQAEGSLGRKLVDGWKSVRIHRETVRVAAKIHTVGGLSAHGDADDMARWYSSFRNRPPVFLVHGDKDAAQAFSDKLRADFSVDVTLSDPGMQVDLTTLRLTASGTPLERNDR